MTNVGTRGARRAREQLIRALVERYGPGDKLPAEAVLAKQLGVSRNTLREALEELQVRGTVTRTWGVGTFMAAQPPGIDYTLSDLVSINALIAASGHVCTAEHEYFGLVVPPPATQRALGLAPDEMSWHTVRRYRADGVRVVVVDEYMRAGLDGQELDPRRIGMDLIAYFQEIDRPLAFAEMHIEPEVARDEMAEGLEVEPGTLVLKTWSTTVADDAVPVVHSIGTMRSDVLRIRVFRKPPLR